MVVWSFHEFKFIGNQHWTNKNTRTTCLKWVASFTLTISRHVFTTFSAATYYWANHFNQHIHTWLHGKHGKCNSEYSCQGLHAVAKIRMLHNPCISDILSLTLLANVRTDLWGSRLFSDNSFSNNRIFTEQLKKK